MTAGAAERSVDLRLQRADLALQLVQAGAGGTPFGVERVGLGAGHLLACLHLGLLLALEVEIGAQATQAAFLLGDLALGALLLGLQADALQVQVGQRASGGRNRRRSARRALRWWS